MSAILLNDDYYEFLRSGVTIADGIPVLDAAHLIPFKAKAWLNLTECKAQGDNIQSKNIRKHKNDVLSLSALFSADFNFELPSVIKDDMRNFFMNVDEPEKYIRVAAVYALSNTIPLSKLPIELRLEEAKRRADIENTNRNSGRNSGPRTNQRRGIEPD